MRDDRSEPFFLVDASELEPTPLARISSPLILLEPSESDTARWFTRPVLPPQLASLVSPGVRP